MAINCGSRGKKLDSLVLENKVEKGGSGVTNQLSDNVGPSCSRSQNVEIIDGESIDELESLFGEISDEDDPTYCPSNDSDKTCFNESEAEEIPEAIPNWVQNNEDFPNEIRQQEEPALIAQQLLGDVINRVWKAVKPLKRWRKADPDSWAQNIAKKRRAEGLSYEVRGVQKPAKLPKKVDCSACKYECNKAFPESVRINICRHYWKLDFLGKKNFILLNVTSQAPTRVLAVPNKRRQRAYTKKCFLSNEFEQKQVCQKFFCATLCIAPAVVVDAIKKKNALNCFDKDDRRGKREPATKTKPEVLSAIRNHIESYPCMEAHYTRKDSKRKILSLSA